PPIVTFHNNSYVSPGRRRKTVRGLLSLSNRTRTRSSAGPRKTDHWPDSLFFNESVKIFTANPPAFSVSVPIRAGGGCFSSGKIISSFLHELKRMASRNNLMTTDIDINWSGLIVIEVADQT